ncbi:bifunctional methylenetetrahydrofolate dehydrogenase/methenyltetrahydrofolate cyclohydrolase [Clostridium sp. LY3-2]|uniref:bifunctional 5,10-methylenetetrahydrofolate dehydrogenase/5,10-methenyltetrahydrofolate cyclohydrolase n=1 Tax=Clostridium sp. LY3-2 TaxID=2942482 RepID=UPI0021531512|nr:tetrahydrofolate dehydrogenase/cyclohydrolase catalytic domain-containing protein [Clostridium sp. LY3-2]MCR6515861.1 bifunctional methylenetetrahydrofolate dehydrogenase/methenyltetrahydrofolate cyclohydrolase [Clostridium sp. LY3-2]
MYKIIDGREVAKKIKLDINSIVEKRKEEGKKLPKIASVLVGDDAGSIYYINSQEKVSNSVGVLFEKVILDKNISEEDLIMRIEELNNDKTISGIMLQLPLPKEINEKKVINTISPLKDIDCLTYESIGKLFSGEASFLPCTPRSVVTLVESLDVNLEGLEVVILGRSNIVGKPAIEMFLEKNATVTVCHSKTKNLESVCKRADILVVAIGKPKFINSNYIKTGAIVIDVGTSEFEGKITGDVDFESVKEKTSFITPVPGGVGALTTTLLIKNSCEALKNYED